MFFFPLFDENATSRRPVIVWLIIVACVFAFLWQQSLDGIAAEMAIYQFGFVPAIALQGETLPNEFIIVPSWATFITSMFLHGGWAHIGANMLYLWIFSDNVEASMGRLKFVLFYLLCGGAAAMAQAALDPSSTIPMIGASGGIAGVLGAYLMLHPKAAIRCFFLILIFFRFINLPAWLVLGVWIGGQFVSVPQALNETGGGVAYMAHIGGFLAGMALIPFFKYRHVALFDRDIGIGDWADRPLNFQEVKAEARARYRRSVPSSADAVRKPVSTTPPKPSVPTSRRKDPKTGQNNPPNGPWG